MDSENFNALMKRYYFSLKIGLVIGLLTTLAFTLGVYCLFVGELYYGGIFTMIAIILGVYLFITIWYKLSRYSHYMFLRDRRSVRLAYGIYVPGNKVF